MDGVWTRSRRAAALERDRTKCFAPDGAGLDDDLLTHGWRHGLQIFRRSAAHAYMQLDKDIAAS